MMVVPFPSVMAPVPTALEAILSVPAVVATLDAPMINVPPATLTPEEKVFAAPSTNEPSPAFVSMAPDVEMGA